MNLDAAVSYADQRQRGGLLDHLADRLNAPLALALSDKIPQPPDDLRRPHHLGRGVFDDAGRAPGRVSLVPHHKPARDFEVVCRRGQGLIDLVRQSRGHLAHFGQARDMRQLRLQFLEAVLGFLPLGQIADKTGEQAASVRLYFADRKLQWEHRAVVALPGDNTPETDDAPLAGGQIAADIGVVVFAIGRRHQHADIAAANLRGGVAKHAFGGGTERLDQALLVDHHHPVRDRVEDRAQQCLVLNQRGIGAFRLGDVA